MKEDEENGYTQPDDQRFERIDLLLRFGPTWAILYTGWIPDSISGIHFGPCIDHQLSEFLAGDGGCTDTDRSWARVVSSSTFGASLPHLMEQLDIRIAGNQRQGQPETRWKTDKWIQQTPSFDISHAGYWY
jgi:hypothetical protein